MTRHSLQRLVAIVACVALFAAAVGTSSAAARSNNSKQVSISKKHKAKRGPRGKRGAQGATGATGAKGPAGPKGDTGSPGPLVTTLPSGKTLRGIYGYAGHQTTGFSPVEPISYQFPLASAPTLNLIEIGEPSTPQCPGEVEDPQAEPGNLCVYEERNDSGTELELFNEVADGRFGAILFASLPDNTDYEFEGTWAVTAP